jgi:hypothetical protein
MHALVLGLFALAAVPAGDEKKIQLPDGPPPAIKVVSAVDADKGVVTFLRVETVKVPVQVTEIVNVGGQQVMVTRTILKDGLRTSYVTQSLQNVRFGTAAGQALKLDEALKRLKPGTAVLVSSDGKAISPAYLAIVNPETLVLVPPVAEALPVPLPPPDLPKPKV